MSPAYQQRSTHEELLFAILFLNVLAILGVLLDGVWNVFFFCLLELVFQLGNLLKNGSIFLVYIFDSLE
jgi:hypothetical protein